MILPLSVTICRCTTLIKSKIVGCLSMDFMFFSKMHKSMDENKSDECSSHITKLSGSTRRHLRKKRTKQEKALTSYAISSSTDIKKNNSDTVNIHYDYNPPVLKNIKRFLDLQECLNSTLKAKDYEVANLLANSGNHNIIHCEHTLSVVEENSANKIDNINSTELRDLIKQENTTFSITPMKKNNSSVDNIDNKSDSNDHFNKNPTFAEINILSEKHNKNKLTKMSELSGNITDVQKSREEILAERKAKKIAKKSKEKPTIKSDSKKSNTVNNDQITENLNSHTINIEKKQNSIEIINGKNAKITNKNNQNDASKTKAELRAERRLKQEQQRAAKATTVIEKSTKNDARSIKNNQEHSRKLEITNTTTTHPLSKFPTQHKVQLFNHLYVDRVDINLYDESSLHASILKLGVQYAARIILGSNSRCIAMLNAIQDVINTHRTPPHEEFGRSLDVVLKKNIEYLQTCRPLSVSMTNSLRDLKWQITQLPNNIKDDDGKDKLLDFIDTFIREQIGKAIEAISITVLQKIANNDVILTYGCSSLIENILTEAHQNGSSFRVIVVDGRPLLEGREMLRRLVSVGIKCTYIMITAMNFIMPEVSKVMLGAHALLANGYVMSRAGTAQVALMANASNIPVLVCCETHKFSERVQTDSFVYNEIGEPEQLIPSEGNILSDWKNTSIIPLNLTYDVTPPDLVTAVVTEKAILPCTSVPVILRIRPAESTTYS